MKFNKLPDVETISKYVEYLPSTGELVWKERTEKDFIGITPSYISRYTKSWNTKYAGKIAYARCGSKYYTTKVLRIHKKMRFAHRVVWKLFYGTDPERIDHINGNTLDNRIENLRVVTHGENMKNSAKRRNSKTVRVGVHPHRLAGKWVARIRAEGRGKHLGVFDSFDDAVAARKAAEIKYGFHPNHGRLQNTNPQTSNP